MTGVVLQSVLRTKVRGCRSNLLCYSPLSCISPRNHVNIKWIVTILFDMKHIFILGFENVAGSSRFLYRFVLLVRKD